jgi:Spy/CpxP family protein refolding chaperone
MIAKALRAAELTPEQRRLVMEIRDRNDERMRGLGRRLIDQRRQLVTALDEPTPNVERARVALRELSATIAEQVVARTSVELELFKLLTPEQRRRVRAFREAQGKARDRAPADAHSGEDLGGEGGPQDDSDVLAGDLEDESPPPAARAGGQLRERRADGARRLRPLLELDLKPEQRRALRELRREHGSRMRGASTGFRDARRALAEALLADTIDAERVNRLGAELARHEVERTRIRFEVEARLLSILTPDQIRRYRELRRQRRAGTAARGLDRP